MGGQAARGDHVISVLCPSRCRPALLRRSIRSLQERESSAHPVEYLIFADYDDPDTNEVAWSLGLRGVSGHRYGYAHLDRYYNQLAKIALGSWLLLWNDDALMSTSAWNEHIESLPDSVLVADLHTDMSDNGVCAFPCVRARAVDIIGDWSPHTSHSDSYWQDLGRLTGTLHPVPVHVIHDRFDLTGNNDDATYRESRGAYRSEEYYSAETQAKIRVDADLLAGR